MVYDDARWAQRLQLMGCWNEAAARARKEEAQRARLNTSREQDLRKGAVSNAGLNRLPNGTRQPSLQVRHDLLPLQPPGLPNIRDDGFDPASLESPTTSTFSPIAGPPENALAALEVIAKCRSIRGASRQEFGRIYAALQPFYKDATRCKTPGNARVFRTYRDPRQQAEMVAQLKKFSKSDTSEGWRWRGRKIDDVIEAFEEAMLGEFGAGLMLKDVEGRMRKYAHVLVTLNGGHRAVERFITLNPIFENRKSFGDPMDCVSMTNPDILFLTEPASFFNNLANACNAQVLVAERVFPDSVDVVTPLLQRIGSDIIAVYISKLLGYLQERSIESYVRAVSNLYEQAIRFTRTLQPSRQSKDVFQEAVDVIILNVFGSHVENYLREELAIFKAKSELEVSSWERQLSQRDASVESMFMSSVNRQADKRDFLSSFKKVVMMPVNVLPAFPISNRFSARPSPKPSESLEGSLATVSLASSRPGSPTPPSSSISRTASPAPEPPTTELAAKAAIMKSRLEGIGSLFSLEVALNLVHLAKASIERAAIFVKSHSRFENEAKSQCEAIFVLLLKTLGTRHVKSGFDQAVAHLSTYNPRAASDHSQPGVAPLVMFLELVNVGDLIQQMLDVFYEQELVATKLTDRNDFLNPTSKEKKNFEKMLDERVAAGLNKGIEVLMAEVEYICATMQNVEDYNPGAGEGKEDVVVDVSPTKTAARVVEVVSSHTRMLVGSTDKNVLDVFNQEVGLRLFAAVCKHLKRQRISVGGSIRLIRYDFLFLSFYRLELALL